MPTLARNDKGEYLELRLNEWVPYTGITPEDREFAAQIADPGEAHGPAAMGIASMAGADYWGPSAMGITPNQYAALREHEQQTSPWWYGGGQLAGAVPGIVAGGASIPGQMVVGAVQGGLAAPDNPAAGAALGGSLAGALNMAGPAYRAAQTGLAGAGERAAAGREFFSGAPDTLGISGAPQRMADRIQQRMAAASDPAFIGPPAPGGRVLQGMITPEEAAASGLRLTPGDEMALIAQSQDDMARASRVRSAEELRRSDPVTGLGIRTVREEQKSWITDAVKRRLGISGGSNLTDEVLGSTLNRLGREFDEFADLVGSVPLGDDIVRQLDDVAEQATGPHGGLVTSLVEDAKKMAAQNDGAISGADWQILNTRLGKMLDAGSRQGDYAKIADASQIQAMLQDLLEGTLPAAAREAMAETRARYGLAKTLLRRRGNRNPEGQVNPISLYGSLATPGRIRSRGADSLLRQLETAKYLEARLTPSSGTAERLLANPPLSGIVSGLVGR